MASIPAYIRVAEQIKSQCLSNKDVGAGYKLPTQEELTAHHGVSRSTIVRALSKLVAEGFLTSQQGSGVYVAETPPPRHMTQRISMIVPRLHAAVITAACRGVEQRARQLGYQFLLASSEFSLAQEQALVEEHIRAGTQGIVMYPVTRQQQEMATDYLTRISAEIPLVTLDIGCEAWNCARIEFDNYRLGYEMTQRLLHHKHRYIAFMHVLPGYHHSSILDREKGWKAAIKEAGVALPASYAQAPVPSRPDFAIATPHFAPTQADYAAFVQELMALRPLPDALIAWNDVVAAHIIQALNNCGVRVPEDMRVTGFDCDPLVSRLFRPLFPTSKPDFARLGELAVDTLHHILTRGQSQPRVSVHSVPVVWREVQAVSMPDALVVIGEDVDSLL